MGDALTGLSNRRGFIDSLETALSDGLHAPTAVLAVDVDHFKAVKESVGYAANQPQAGGRLRSSPPEMLSTCRVRGQEVSARSHVFARDQLVRA